MPAFTMHIPENLTGNSEKDIAALKDWGVALIDNLSYMFAHLDAANVTKAASVDAENINTNTALIQSAQIRNLQADKIAAGTLDLTHGITIAGERNGNNNYLTVTKDSISFVDNGHERLFIGKERVEIEGEKRDIFMFRLADENGKPKVWIDNDGDACFSGIVSGGKIISDTTVDVSTDLNIGENIHIRKKKNSTSWYETGGIFFDGNTVINDDGEDNITVINGRIGMKEGKFESFAELVPTFMMCTPDGGKIEITTGTGQNNAGDDLLLRGKNVRIGVPNGSNGKVLINNSEALTMDNISKCQTIKDLQTEIDRLKGMMI